MSPRRLPRPRGRLAVSLISLAALAAAVGSTDRAEAGVALGAYIPGAEHHAGRIDSYARKVGRRPLIVGSYKDWGPQPFQVRELRRVWRRGSVPMITWEPWGFPLRAIARGRYDRYARSAARAAERWGRPLFLRFAHEMNGDWYPWGRRTGAAVYKAAWRRLVQIFRRTGAHNVRWVWNPYVNSRGGRLPFAGRYPGDPWVDWVGLDVINWGGSFPWRSFRQIVEPSYRRLARLSGRPIMIGETGSGESGGSKPSWVGKMLRRDVPRMPRIRALLFWSRADARGDQRVDSSRAALRSLRRSARRPLYRSSRRSLFG